MRLFRQTIPEAAVKRMVDFVQAAERGDFSVTLPVRSPGELGELEKSLNWLVDEIRQSRERWEEQKALQRELKVSRVIQTTLLPATTPVVPGMELAPFYRPAQQVGGDYYDFIEVDADHLGIAVADVAGKSVSGAILMTIARNTVRAQAMLTLSPGEVLDRTQRMLLPNIMPQFFVTILYGVLDKRYQKLTVANAGHPPLLVYRAEAGQCEAVRAEGIALGLSRNGTRPSSRQEQEVFLEKGDLALFYTDGITDLANSSGQRFGRERLTELVRGAGTQGARGLLQRLEKELASFGGDVPPGDDMTAVVLSRQPDSRKG